MMTEKAFDELVQEVSQVRTENLVLAQALHTIIGESNDAEVVRISMAALTGTETGKNYLTANPLRF